MSRKSASSRRGGFSLVEVLIALTLLAVLLGGLSNAGLLAARQVKSSRNDLQVWAVEQRVADSLRALNVSQITTGSTVVSGQTIQWVVRDTMPPARVDLVISKGGVPYDTTALFLPKR